MDAVNAKIYSVETAAERAEALSAAATAVQGGKVIVVPTDTVYGIAADAFSAGGVRALLAAKGRSRQMPPPVLIYSSSVLAGLADDISDEARALADAFWPGPLTLICYAQPSLTWDLGDTKGTVALRVPSDDLTIDLLRQTGPLAVSSANKTGRVAATTAAEAADQLGENVELIVDGGIRPVNRGEDVEAKDIMPSTIVDCTGETPVIVREGAIGADEIRSVAPGALTKRQWDEQRRIEAQQALDARAMAEEPTAGSVSAAQVADEIEHEPIKPARRASAPSNTSHLSKLVGASTSTGGVDQLRTEGAHFVESQRAQDVTKPLSVDTARSLVFGTKK
ncbi:threonylcarbamoyl-AMP synthase [Rothia sp. ZJ932]|nr:threonylcarbamoyl-AMP synthase [Rothia sp. ZJ932]